MLQLQRNLCVLLRQAALLERIGELVGLADSHQKLCLREQRLYLHALLFCGGSQRREVQVCRDVLLARRLIGVGGNRMLAVCGDRAAMTSGKLLGASVAVVNGDDKSPLDARGQARHEQVGEAGGFDPLSVSGMDAIAVEIFEVVSRGRYPGLSEAPVLFCDAQFALQAENFDRQGVEEFVGEDDEWAARRRGYIRAAKLSN